MTRVVVVGAGLAGLTCALRLAERGCAVTLFEANSYAGGKASARPIDGKFEDHGFHFFGGWYQNVRQLIRELGVGRNFIDVNEFVDLRRGEFPRYRLIHNPARISWHTFAANVRSAFLSLPDLFLFHYSTLELLAQPFTRRRLLDQISVHGFVMDRFYASTGIAEQHNEVLFKSISNPSFLVSAMTYQKMLAYWAGSPAPMFQMLKTDLHHGFIEPLLDRVTACGASLRFGHRLVHVATSSGQVNTLTFVTGSGAITHAEFDACVLAIPHEALTALVDDQLYMADPMFGSLRNLRSEPMAACTIYCHHRLAGVPDRHVICRASTLGLSFVDIGQVWSGVDRTVLNVVAADYTMLKGLSDRAAIDLILAELRAYLPQCTPDAIERVVLQAHTAEPLFMNDVGVWPHRPTTTTRLSNCFLAGDFCQNEIDLVSMESAVVSGMHAAREVLAAAGSRAEVEIIVPPTPPRALLVAAKVFLLPIAVLAWLARPLWR